MSKINCPNCRYFNETEQLCYKWKSRMYADHSCEHFEAVQMANATVFQQLTASPEGLAPKLVYCVPFVTVGGKGFDRWYSTLEPFDKDIYYYTKEKAIEVTLAKLKEAAEAQPATN